MRPRHSKLRNVTAVVSLRGTACEVWAMDCRILLPVCSHRPHPDAMVAELAAMFSDKQVGRRFPLVRKPTAHARDSPQSGCNGSSRRSGIRRCWTRSRADRIHRHETIRTTQRWFPRNKVFTLCMVLAIYQSPRSLHRKALDGSERLQWAAAIGSRSFCGLTLIILGIIYISTRRAQPYGYVGFSPTCPN